MAYFQRNRFGFKEEEQHNVYPANNIARLMYYFNCVCHVIQYKDTDVNRLRDFNKWASLSGEDIRLLFVLCGTLSPDVFNNKVFFQSDALCGDSANKFYEINQIRDQIVAVNSIVIAGQQYRVNKIMAYKLSWIYDNYINPMKWLAQQLNPRAARSSTCVVS